MCMCGATSSAEMKESPERTKGVEEASGVDGRKQDPGFSLCLGKKNHSPAQ
jgi:hypothetical protein